MRFIVNISRLLVGVLFIISGLIKLNDPLGFSYKLEEYFSEPVLNLPFLEPYALIISVSIVVFEVVLGVFLLIGYRPKFTIWSLLGMILFFTFLTFYSAYFDKVKDCGCFGDALKLTPWESFTKDVILLFFVLILFVKRKRITPIFNKPIVATVIAFISFMSCLWFAYHVLMHLPAKDFRPYKIGANLIENMSIPEDAPKAVQEFTWTFNVAGKKEVIITDGSYPQVNGEFIGVTTKVIKEGYQPPIHDFSIENDEGDFTEAFLAEEKLIVIVAYNLSTVNSKGMAKVEAVTNKAIKSGYKVIGLTASGKEEKQKIKSEFKLNFDFYLCDEKALKTIIRSNPGILKLNKGTVIQKLHWNDADDLKL